MLPSSVRRVVSTAPQSPIIGTVGAVAAAAVGALSARTSSRHHRRYSSSNPSSPDNGPKGLPPSASDRSMPAQTTKSSASGDKRRKRAKEPADRSPSFKALPSVPSTQHVPRESLALSAFFSLHRPMSITSSLPRAVTEQDFASIFLRRGSAEKTQDVISTLSNTVHELEQPMENLGLSKGESERADGVREITLRNADGSDSGVCVQLNDMLGSKFQPFCPPPLPQPASSAMGGEAGTYTSAATEDGVQADGQVAAPTQRKLYKAILTIEETVDDNGEVKYIAHSSALLEDSATANQPRSFLERMAARQLRFEDAQRQRQDGMLAISVKRQRKLKMKKKKYKKLMKKTRNERRKLHRL